MKSYRQTLRAYRDLYYEKHIDLYASVTGALLMGVFHLITTLLHFSWLTLNYSLYSFVLMFVRILLFYLDKSQNKKKLYLAGSLSLCVLLVPMTVSMVKTILEKDAPVYFFFWTIYLYATYGTVKFIMAVKTRHKARKSGDVLSDVKSMLSLVTACYTIQMMEFALIATFDSAKSNSMQVMQFMTHGAVIIFTVIVIFLLFAKYRRSDR